ncbi:hypothetical protein VTP01DRAFT_10861 [Rhizomucor pusillus]|uniref:uncharacterized protein n=1 Tax=Rhizomucor pusillus TaxID=4840 RepID=UPI0037422C67
MDDLPFRAPKWPSVRHYDDAALRHRAIAYKKDLNYNSQYRMIDLSTFHFVRYCADDILLLSTKLEKLLHVKQQNQPATTICIIDGFKSSTIPDFIQVEGPYKVLDEKIERILSMDFRTFPGLLPHGARLFSAPIFIGLVDESDGHGQKKKFKIGSLHMNIFVTSSVMLCQDFLAISLAIEKYLSLLESSETKNAPVSVGDLRQVLLSFADPSTYMPYRATLESFDNDFFSLRPSLLYAACPTTVKVYSTVHRFNLTRGRGLLSENGG